MPTSTILSKICRAHQDERGVSTIEFILAAPSFMMIMFLLFDLGMFRTGALQASITNRNALWQHSSGGFCFGFSNLPELAKSNTITGLPVCRDVKDRNSGSSFWQNLDAAGGENLTGTVSGVTPPKFIEAETRTHYSPHPFTDAVFKPFTAKFTMVSREAWMHDEAELKVGYDREMKSVFQRDTGAVMRMFPNVFPGAGQ